jgi:hypothetical protein
MIQFILTFLLSLQVNEPVYLCPGITIEEWKNQPTEQQLLKYKKLCQDSVDGFPQWIQPIQKIKAKAIAFKIRFVPTDELMSASLISRYGYVDYATKTIFVTDDPLFLEETLPHEIYHALSRQYGVWKRYSPQDEELMADRFSEYIRGNE